MERRNALRVQTFKQASTSCGGLYFGIFAHLIDEQRDRDLRGVSHLIVYLHSTRDVGIRRCWTTRPLPVIHTTSWMTIIYMCEPNKLFTEFILYIDDLDVESEQTLCRIMKNHSLQSTFATAQTRRVEAPRAEGYPDSYHTYFPRCDHSSMKC